MRKKTIAAFYFSGIALVVISVAIIAHITAPIQRGFVLVDPPPPSPGLVAGVITLTVIGVALILIALIGALVNSARAGRWGWFIGLLFLNWFAPCVYLLFGDSETASFVHGNVQWSSWKLNPFKTQKRTLAMLYFMSLMLLLIAIVVVNITTPSSFHPELSQSDLVLMLIAVLLALVSIVLFGIAWIQALQKLAKAGSWGWFVCLLVLGWVAFLPYLFAGPVSEDSAVVRRRRRRGLRRDRRLQRMRMTNYS